MNEAAEKIKSMITTHQPLVDMLSGGLHWELAPETVERPFITFSLSENQKATKERSGDYDVQLFIWAINLTASGQVKELVEDAALAYNEVGFRYRGANTGYTTDEARDAFLQMNFNFKIKL
ncbi:MAG: hypothetical protein AAF039_16005 [Bacteroidota bacterium]